METSQVGRCTSFPNMTKKSIRAKREKEMQEESSPYTVYSYNIAMSTCLLSGFRDVLKGCRQAKNVQYLATICSGFDDSLRSSDLIIFQYNVYGWLARKNFVFAI